MKAVAAEGLTGGEEAVIRMAGGHRQGADRVFWGQELENSGCRKITLGSSDWNMGSGGVRPEPAVRRCVPGESRQQGTTSSSGAWASRAEEEGRGGGQSFK